MHIAWLGKRTPFCGNVTYSREITNSLVERGHRVSFLHFDNTDLYQTTSSASPLAPSHHAPAIATSGQPLYRDYSFEPHHHGSNLHGPQRHDPSLHDPNLHDPNLHEIAIPYLYKSQIYTVPSLNATKVLTNTLKRLKPDVVHASLALSFLDFALPGICHELGIPLVATFHPAFDDKRRSLTSITQHLTYQLYAPFLAHYAQVIVFSDIQRNLLLRLGVPEERVAVIPNGVDIGKYCPSYSPIKTQLQAERLFVYQGRLSIEKNVAALLKAWTQSNMGPHSKLVIIGDGPLSSQLMETYSGDDGVVWLGYVADEQQRIAILQGADVFILPSLVEGLSLSLLEAMACGLACIATDAGADGEVLAHGAGIVLNTHRVDHQLRTLLPMCRDQPELTQLLGQKARQRVLERYTLSRNISHVEDIYTQVLQQQQATLYVENFNVI